MKEKEKIPTDTLYGVTVTAVCSHEPEDYGWAEKRLKSWGLTLDEAIKELERREDGDG